MPAFGIILAEMDQEREDIQLSSSEPFRLLRWKNSVNSVEVVKAGRANPIRGFGDHWHFHRAMELTFIAHGGGTRFVADHIEMFHTGDLVLIGSNVPHYWHSPRRYAGLSLQWDFPPEHGIWNFGEAVAPLRTLSKAALRGLHLYGPTAAAAAKAMAELADLDGLPRLLAFLELLSSITRAPPEEIRPLAARAFSIEGTADHQDAIARAVSYILAHHHEPVRLKDLLRLTGMSRATFARQFVRHAGKPFSVFVNQVRLQAVCRALIESKTPISTIAFDHGFNQLSFFNRIFRRELGTSPTEYRSRPLPGHSTDAEP